jgi:hypothetical protein
MRTRTRAVLALASVLLGSLFVVSCAEKGGVCPTISCTPEITVAYASPLTAPYYLQASLREMLFSSDCPKDPPQTGPVVGIASCGNSGFLLQGVDLGSGSNMTVDLTVSIDQGPSMSVTATLQSIVNSRDCELICFKHTGTLAN